MFMETSFTKNKFLAMINMQSWMFLNSFEKLRKTIIENKTVLYLIHLGAHAFEEISGEVVQTVSFVIRNKRINHYNSKFLDLQNIDAKNQGKKFLRRNICCIWGSKC